MVSLDYVKAFSNLKGINSMIVRQKAILLLAVMELVARKIIDSNKIQYNEELTIIRMGMEHIRNPI